MANGTAEWRPSGMSTPTSSEFDSDASAGQLGSDVTLELRKAGFVVVPDILGGDRLRQLERAYDLAVARATPPDLRVGSETTRVHGLVNAGPEFERLSVHPQVLAACRVVIGRPFRLSGLLARTVRPRSRAQALHVDARADTNGWPMVGFMLMLDAFSVDNGATRFVPGSHEWSGTPVEDQAGQVLALGAAGSLVIYNGSVWHGHSANQTDSPRRSVQGAYIRSG
jgi:ectoine hydroxylase-related dioxygenase (phytanoyl-CoA dioxygenase family)